MCNHWRQPVKVGRRIVTCSGWASRPHVIDPVDFGVYLSREWKEELGGMFSTNGVRINRVANGVAYPALFVTWMDMGVLDPGDLGDLVEICLSKMRQGKIIDIGCFGGLGRTGVLLSCLIARVEHLSGIQAVIETRRRYDSRAVETLPQERSVVEYAQRIK